MFLSGRSRGIIFRAQFPILPRLGPGACSGLVRTHTQALSETFPEFLERTGLVCQMYVEIFRHDPFHHGRHILTMSRAASCGSRSAPARSFTGPQGTPALKGISIFHLNGMLNFFFFCDRWLKQARGPELLPPVSMVFSAAKGSDPRRVIALPKHRDFATSSLLSCLPCVT